MSLRYLKLLSIAEWLKEHVPELLIMSEPVPTTSIHTDSKFNIELLKQDTINRKPNGYMHISFRFVQSLIEKYATLDSVKSEKNLVDHFTKGLSWNASKGMG